MGGVVLMVVVVVGEGSTVAVVVGEDLMGDGEVEEDSTDRHLFKGGMVGSQGVEVEVVREVREGEWVVGMEVGVALGWGMGRRHHNSFHHSHIKVQEAQGDIHHKGVTIEVRTDSANSISHRK